MSNLLLISNAHPQSFVNSGRYYALFNLMKSQLDFRIEVVTNYEIDDIKEDVVIIFKSPEKDKPYVMSNLVDLPKNKTFISYYSDIHTGGLSNDYTACMNRLLERSNKVLCAYNTPFIERWKVYQDKHIFFPHFVDHNLYSELEVNPNPKMQCLVSGAAGKSYPLRRYIINKGESRINVLPHPGYKPTEATILKNSGWKIGRDYSRTLNEHFCSVATPGYMGYAVAKYFEIPASGSLLLGKWIPDLDTLGFVDHKHYIAIDENNFSEVLQEVLDNPKKYEDIRKHGRDFVLNNFTEEHSLEKLKRILDE